MRDVKSLGKVLEEIRFHGILVLDRGFASYDLAELLSFEIKSVVPLGELKTHRLCNETDIELLLSLPRSTV
ncbi:MAG: hypothetical protein QXQ46_10685 [Thermoplasmatales archaeon]